MKKTDSRIELTGTEALTAAQAAAVCKALQSVLMRDDNCRGDPGYEPTLGLREWQRAYEALQKIKFRAS